MTSPEKRLLSAPADSTDSQGAQTDRHLGWERMLRPSDGNTSDGQSAPATQANAAAVRGGPEWRTANGVLETREKAAPLYRRFNLGRMAVLLGMEGAGGALTAETANPAPIVIMTLLTGGIAARATVVAHHHHVLGIPPQIPRHGLVKKRQWRTPQG